MTEPRDRWPDQPDERDAPWTPPAPEHTQPLDVSHTQALPPAPMGEPRRDAGSAGLAGRPGRPGGRRSAAGVDL